MYLDGRWEYDHEYFQQMIKRDVRMNTKVVGCIITGMSDLNKDKSSSGDDSMLDLQDRAREDSFSNNDSDSIDDDGIYNDGEPWGYKAQILKQIIGGTPGGMFPNNILTLCIQLVWVCQNKCKSCNQK